MLKQRLRMSFRFDFDPANKILITWIDGELTDDLIRKVDAGMRKRLTQKRPAIHIVPSSRCRLNQFAIWLGASLRLRERLSSLLRNAQYRRVRIARMFQLVGEPHYDSMMILRSVDEVFSTLGITRTRFEPLE